LLVGDEETVDAEHAAVLVEDAAHPARSGGMEEAARVGANVAEEVDAASRTQLSGDVTRERLGGGELAQPLEPRDDRRRIVRVREEAVIDRERGLRVLRRQTHRAA